MSPYATTLIDCHFFSADSGFVTGGKDSVYPNSKAVVLFNSDGGESWVTRYSGTNVKEWGWKMSFPTKNFGYTSLENHGNPTAYFLKTTNGGVNWQQKVFLNRFYDEEGIGFINENTGWIGGWFERSYKTTNGGNNWLINAWGNFATGDNFNRFRKINDTLAYAVGLTVFKYSRDTLVGINQISSEIPNGFDLKQNYPNPFNP